MLEYIMNINKLRSIIKSCVCEETQEFGSERCLKVRWVNLEAILFNATSAIIFNQIVDRFYSALFRLG